MNTVNKYYININYVPTSCFRNWEITSEQKQKSWSSWSTFYLRQKPENNISEMLDGNKCHGEK